ncbi:MAG: O-antigen ligase family protein [Paramuribaculum sp.]|nr:O-antigen ligase family protein [Paramuribaculum sp.]
METPVQTYKVAVLELISIALLGAGLWECGLGWAQLFGITPSHHSLYPATGTFYNPGPYCGFLAMLVPLALRHVLKPEYRFTNWLATAYIILAVAIMPVLMGRTGWIAAAVGCLLVAVGCGRIKRPRPVVLIAVFAVAAIAGALLFYLKPASALGRLFLWRMGLDAAFQHPLTGVGWNQVAGALGAAQETYFNSSPESMFANVAGTPEYAFNEFLQIGIAFGIPAMLLFIILLVLAARMAWRGGAYGVAGSIAAFSVVCFSSYPLQFPEFMVAVGIMIAGAFFASPCRCVLVKWTLYLLLACGITFACRWLMHRNELAGEWERMRYVCRYRLDDRSIHLLDSLDAIHGHSPKYLFDYGKALRETGLYDKSNGVLMRGVELSADPMFLNLIGRNYYDLGQYGKAEHYFLRAADRLPGRMYPYYLLARMYADPAVNDSVRFSVVHEKVVRMSPKIMSPAIRQMRSELDSLRTTFTR